MSDIEWLRKDQKRIDWLDITQASIHWRTDAETGRHCTVIYQGPDTAIGESSIIFYGNGSDLRLALDDVMRQFESFLHPSKAGLSTDNAKLAFPPRDVFTMNDYWLESKE